MNQTVRGLAVLGWIAATGALQLPSEHRFSHELMDAGLLKRPLPIGTREKIGQTSSAVALGGLRTLVATFLNLRAYDFFELRQWYDLADTYDIIVQLAPDTRYYWQSASWHLAYNAAADLRAKQDLPPLRRLQAWKEAILRGRRFLEDGTRNMPGDWRLWSDLGRLLQDPLKLPDQAAAANAYLAAWNTGTAPAFIHRLHFYSLARAPGREADALALGRKLYADPRNRLTTLCCLMFVLETRAGAAGDDGARAANVFGGERPAYDALTLYWHRVREKFPMDGVAGALAALERSLGVPAGKSVLHANPPNDPPPGIAR